MVKEGQTFKNYRELCLYLGEDIKGGKSKELQIKRWQFAFDYHKDGNKIVIDKVKEKSVRYPEKKGGNKKHVENFLPYVILSLCMSGIEDEYVSTQRMLKSELKLIPASVYDEYNYKGRNHEEFLAVHGISSYESFRKFIHYFETLASETVRRCFDELSRDKGIEWSPGNVFIVGLSHHKPVYTIGYEKILEDIETFVCNEMNKELGLTRLKGRQLLHVIKRNKELMKNFYSRCIEILSQEDMLMAGLKKKYEKTYGMEFDSEMIVDYYKVYYIGSINPWKLKAWSIGGRGGIALRKALETPDGSDMRYLKKKVYEDVFSRMIKRSKDGQPNNKYGISNEDFDKLKALILS